MLASCNDVAQESPHFENGLISALFGPHVERMGSLRPRICRGATSLSTIARPELALQDSSYESRRIKMPTSSCILALEKMRGWPRPRARLRLSEAMERAGRRKRLRPTDWAKIGKGRRNLPSQ